MSANALRVLDMLREEEMKAYNAMLKVDNFAPDRETLIANANYQTTKRLYAKARVLLTGNQHESRNTTMAPDESRNTTTAAPNES